MTSDEYRLHTDLVKIANSIEKLTDELRKHRPRTRNEIREAFGIPPVEQKRPSEDDRA